ncbi:hypothetical protein RND71_005262 [Anisodus tanguticus]|uniref:Uncharacterized protein n=1 Tax=Anisodus tanguticus TaxID=243964 RepID=A0AAE1SRP3_9SOLA|nr:hypothetical protein RND71_005262 [Anisodus tanguticus]
MGMIHASERTSNIKACEPGNGRSALQRETEKDTFLSGLLDALQREAEEDTMSSELLDDASNPLDDASNR